MASKKQPQVGYKAVSLQNGKLVSFYKPVVEYKLGKLTKQAVKPDHESGLYLYTDLQTAITYAKNSHKDSLAVIIKCRYRKPIITYEFEGKIAVTGIIPLSIEGYVVDGEYQKIYGDIDWLINHFTKYQNGKLPPQPAIITCGNQTFNINDCNKIKRGKFREIMKSLKTEA
jgi:hypothetical protein